MNITAKKLVLIIIILCLRQLYGQQQAQYSQYMYNTNVINPAYAGSKNLLSINGIHRSQWIGLEGAPRTQTMSIHSPMGQQVGLGLNIVRDEIGPSLETYVNIDFSYTIPIDGKDTYFAFGLKGGLSSLNVDFGKLRIYHPTDPAIQNTNINKQSPMIGVGGYLYSNKWYVGLSTPNVLKTYHYTDTSISRASEESHMYLMGGYVFTINKNLKFKPASLLKIVQGAPISLDLSANFLVNNRFTMGASYRLDSAISGLFGFQLSDQLMLGYSYDYDTTEIRGFTSGSHEFFVRFEFISRVRGAVSPRFF